MKLEITRAPSYPALGWSARIERSRSPVRALLGHQVEAGEQALVEGAWSGVFPTHGFADARTFTGTGMSLDGARIRASSPTHTLAPIFLSRTEEACTVANSLALLLSATDDHLDPHYPFYDADMRSIMFGIGACAAWLPTRNGRRVEVHYLANLVIGQDLSVAVEPKAVTAPIRDFASYRSLVQEEARQVVENARDARRAFPYRPMTTVSSGYDSPACAVVAKGCGVAHALTLKQASGDFAEEDDSGADIARLLSLDVVEIPKDAYLKKLGELADIEIVAAGFGSDDMPLIGSEPYLRGSLLFTGYHGDKIWDSKPASVSTTVRRGDVSGSSLLEFRLRAGFLNFPVPFIGCLSHPDIFRITESPEMAPWRLGNAYDRPIPRRMVEETGVPRHMFGQSKKAVALPYKTTAGRCTDLAAILSRESLGRFREHLRTSGIMTSGMAFDRLLGSTLRSHKVAALLDRLPPSRGMTMLRWRHRNPLSEHNFVTAWAANTLRDAYHP